MEITMMSYIAKMPVTMRAILLFLVAGVLFCGWSIAAPLLAFTWENWSLLSWPTISFVAIQAMPVISLTAYIVAMVFKLGTVSTKLKKHVDRKVFWCTVAWMYCVAAVVFAEPYFNGTAMPSWKATVIALVIPWFAGWGFGWVDKKHDEFRVKQKL